MVLPEMLLPMDSSKDTISKFKKSKITTPMAQPRSGTFRGNNRLLVGPALNEQPVFRENPIETDHDGQYRNGSFGY
jgi:hypothetical protein